MKNFYNYLSKVVLIGLTLFGLSTFVTAQSISKNAQQDRKKELPKFNIFRPTASLRSGTETQQNVQFFELDKSLSRVLYQTAPSNILFSINLGEENALEIEMERVELFSPNCKLLDANDKFIPLPGGKFYQSLSKDTTILLGFFEDEVIGHLYLEDAQFHLSKIPSSTLRSTAEYALHTETENHENERVCGTTGPMLNEDELRKIQTETSNIELRSSVGPILNMYYEVDYEAYLRALRVKPQDQTVTAFITNWLSGVFFIKKVLYFQRTGINMRINTFKIWNTKDPYTGSDDHKLLENFSNVLYQKNFPGDFAQLIHARAYSNGIAGVAWLPRGGRNFCKGNSRFSIVNAGEIIGTPPSKPYIFPFYNWPANLMAHELGHNLNADHSQSCSYTGRPLDNCSAPEGCGTGLVGPDPPAGGGHFMSYCHATNFRSRVDFGTADSRYTAIDQRIVQAWTSLPCAKDGVHKDNPDLISITSPTANSSYKPGEQITVRWTLSTVAEVQIVLQKASNGQTWTLSRQTYGFGNQERKFTLSSSLVPGNDYTVKIGILGSNFELTSTKGGESPRFNIVQPLPDLLITSGDLTISGTTVSPQIDIKNLRISNRGNANAVATRYSLLISRDEVIGSGDQLLLSFDLEALVAGRVTTKEFSMTLNTTLIPNGTYYVGLMVDRSDLVKESNEQNNTFYWATPKLLVDKGSVNPSLAVSPTSLNFGASGGSENLTISSNTSWNITESLSWISLNPGSGTNNSSVAVACLSNSSSSSRTGTLTLTGGGKTITINITQAGVTSTGSPDLTCTIGDLNITRNGNIQQISISNLSIANQGNADAAASRLGVYLSSDPQFSTADQLLKNINLTALRANSVEIYQTEISLNTSSLSPGQYYIGVIVDNEFKVVESNENNNTYYWASPTVNITVTPPSPTDCTCDEIKGASLLLCEDFENKIDGPISTQSSSNWRLWDAQSRDGYVARNSTIGDKSLLISTLNNVDADVLLLLGNKQSGTYELSWYMYIPTGNNGYFNVQYDQNLISHSFEVYFQNGAISLKLNGTPYPSSVRFNNNTWMRIKLIIDIDGRVANVYLGDQKVATLPYTHGKLGAIDFYAYKDINAAYWVDDICFYKLNTGNTSNEKSDLTVGTGQLSINSTVSTPEIIFSNVQILNQGKGFSAQSKAEFYVSDNSYISSSDVLIGSLNMESIAPGAYLNKSISFKAPESLAPGEYFVGMIIDPGNVVDETVETNNTYYWPSPKLTIASKKSCATPSGLKIKSLSSSAFYLVWDYNPAIISYRVELSYDLGQTWFTFDKYGNGNLIGNDIAFYGIEAGKRVLFKVKSICENSESDWTNILDFSLPLNATNDEPCSAAALDANGFFTLGDLSNSKVSNLPYICGLASKDTWFKITATAPSMTLTVSKLASVTGTDYILEVYGGTCGSLQFIECNDDGGSELFPKLTLNNLTIGRTYYVRVWDLNSTGTSFWINAYQFGQSSTSIVAPPQSLIGQDLSQNIGFLKAKPSIADVSNRISLKVAPNPNDGNFTVDYNSPIQGKITLMLKDPMGRIHYQKSDTQNTELSRHELRLTDLPTGMYIISIVNEQGVETNAKMIVTH